MSRNLELVSLILSEGCLEILEFLNENEVGHFKDFKELRNSRTNKIFSGNTISERLKQLIDKQAIKRTVSTSTKGRNVVAYEITHKGKSIIETAYKFEGELKHIIEKN